MYKFYLWFNNNLHLSHPSYLMILCNLLYNLLPSVALFLVCSDLNKVLFWPALSTFSLATVSSVKSDPPKIFNFGIFFQIAPFFWDFGAFFAFFNGFCCFLAVLKPFQAILLVFRHFEAIFKGFSPPKPAFSAPKASKIQFFMPFFWHIQPCFEPAWPHTGSLAAVTSLTQPTQHLIPSPEIGAARIGIFCFKKHTFFHKISLILAFFSILLLNMHHISRPEMGEARKGTFLT